MATEWVPALGNAEEKNASQAEKVNCSGLAPVQQLFRGLPSRAPAPWTNYWPRHGFGKPSVIIFRDQGQISASKNGWGLCCGRTGGMVP